LPVRGRVTVRFGTRRPYGDLRWKGIFLATPSGKEVKAVFSGRVVFADWLQGYGLLLILEHGDGYMTLYGNNESLTQQTGDRVEAGNVIAVTGNTGNIARSGLYFEVRHQGKPRNPLRWFRRG
jgi:septal ring factor EnvC (AmiA/AmiB activator)